MLSTYRRFLPVLMFAVIPFGKVCLDCTVPMVLPMTMRQSDHMAVAKKIDCSVRDAKIFRAHSHLDDSCRVSDTPNAVQHGTSDLSQIPSGFVTSVVSVDGFDGGTTISGLLANVGPPDVRLLIGTTVKRE